MIIKEEVLVVEKGNVSSNISIVERDYLEYKQRLYSSSKTTYIYIVGD